MTGPFQTEPARTGLAARLLGRKTRDAAAAAIEAHLASTPQLADITHEQIAALANEHGLDLDRLRAQCRMLYQRYFEFCLVDRALSEDELRDLAHLRTVLAIDAHIASAVHAEVGYAVYGSAIDEALNDSRMEGDEREFLQRLSDTLGLEEEAATQALEEGKTRARQRYLADHLSPGALFASPGDQKLEVEGSSGESLEAAVLNALEKAETVLPNLERAKVSSIHIDVDSGRVREWRVTLQEQGRVRVPSPN